MNPIFGGFNLPADIRSNLLFGYYGVASQGGEFPSAASDGYYVNADYALTDKDLEILGYPETFDYYSGDILLEDGEEGDSLKIGTLYLTVNKNHSHLTIGHKS